jgi:hypothetical protein
MPRMCGANSRFGTVAISLGLGIVLNVVAPASGQPAGELALHTSQIKIVRLGADALSATAEFRVDDAASVVVNIASFPEDVSTSITGPNSEVIDAQSVETLGGIHCAYGDPEEHLYGEFIRCFGPGFHHLYSFPSLGPGIYRVNILPATTPVSDVAVAAELLTDSYVGAGLLATEATLHPGSVGVLTAAVFEGEAPKTGAVVTARIKPPTGDPVTVALLDNGEQADNAVGDGLYSGIYQVNEVGEYTIVADITGLTSIGTPFTRMCSTSVRVITPGATLSGAFTDAGVDTNSNGLFNLLRICAPLTVTSPGDYILTVTLRSASGGHLYGYKYGTLVAGAQSICADIPSDKILDLNEAGPYTIEEAELRFVGPNGAEPSAALHEGQQQTQAYTLSQFESRPLRLTGDYSCSDTNGSGLTQLHISIGVEVPVAGTYHYGAALRDACGGYVEYIYGDATFLVRGISTLDFVFDGTKIGQRGIDGPYNVSDLGLVSVGNGTQVGPGGALTASFAAQTPPMLATQFAGYHAPPDCDQDGVPDRCEIWNGQDCNIDGVSDDCQHSPGTRAYPGSGGRWPARSPARATTTRWRTTRSATLRSCSAELMPAVSPIRGNGMGRSGPSAVRPTRRPRVAGMRWSTMRCAGKSSSSVA